MAANHTPNYNLSQWEPSDPVLRADFNADNLKIDTALMDKAGKAVIYDQSNPNSMVASQEVHSLRFIEWSVHDVVCIHKFYKGLEQYPGATMSITLGTVELANIPVQDFLLVFFPLRDDSRQMKGVLLCSAPRVFNLEEVYSNPPILGVDYSPSVPMPGKCYFGLG